jgi:hypothetical protein
LYGDDKSTQSYKGLKFWKHNIRMGIVDLTDNVPGQVRRGLLVVTQEINWNNDE